MKESRFHTNYSLGEKLGENLLSRNNIMFSKTIISVTDTFKKSFVTQSDYFHSRNALGDKIG